MAEFSEIIKQFKRMCWYYSRDKGQKSCPICTSYPNCNIGQCRKIAFEKPAHFAATVMRWAAENPEPVYPAWGEWLEKQGVVKTILSPRYKENGASYYELMYEITNPIPADIAQKLGLQPKEG